MEQPSPRKRRTFMKQNKAFSVFLFLVLFVTTSCRRDRSENHDSQFSSERTGSRVRPKSNCGSPSNTIQPATHKGNYPLMGDCLGTNTSIPSNETVFLVTDWSATEDENGRNIHTYSYDDLLPCDPCFGTNPRTGSVDDLYIIDCEDSGKCAPDSPLPTQKTKITLQKIH